SGLIATLPVAVREIERIEIEPANLVLRPGQTASLRAWATFNDGSPRRDVTHAVTWRSQNRSVVAIESVPGQIRALGDGSALIEARDRLSRVRSDDATGRVRVVGEITRLVVEPAQATLAPGDQFTFRALA